MAAEVRALDGSSHGDDEVWVDLPTRFEAELFAQALLDEWGAGGAADHHDFTDLGGGEAGVVEGLADADEGLVDVGADQIFVKLAAEFEVEVEVAREVFFSDLGEGRV